jgi:hypothetical protein
LKRKCDSGSLLLPSLSRISINPASFHILKEVGEKYIVQTSKSNQGRLYESLTYK